MYCSFYQAAKDLRMTKLADECCQALGIMTPNLTQREIRCFGIALASDGG